ncbi:MAG: NADH-quinone oxidoreductase subunit L [Alphaproteobacteria bacterium]|nr:NADH-quinone oxidoreductase subunit L [Alphaproteobacteria bacterium]
MSLEVVAVFAPLVGFILAFLFGKNMGDKGAQFVTCTGIIVAAIASIMLFFEIVMGHEGHGGEARTLTLMTWFNSGALSVEWALRLDQLAVVMMCVVTIVSSCVHVYSVGYMSHDKCKARFMSYLSLFSFAMMMLVTSDNLVQLFFGWEGVGVASYLLIGFWNHKDSANAASIKAFLVNRVGDFGLALGIFAAFFLFGTVQFDELFSQAAESKDTVMAFLGYDLNAITLVCLLLFMGAMGKSAQLGLHTWLPDAMEGPTPVSALIHAATMVTAGVFLVARLSPLFEYAPTALMVVTVVGGVTAFVAATIGMTQFDIKRVIAYSTMSQLGYMFFALGVSAYGAAIFHLMTHAFFKALLFLGAGSVIHAMSDEQDMRKMGGIWKKIPMTYVLMWIGSLALAGVPFFAGYYSKDMILESAFADHTWFGDFAFWLGIAAAIMTAFYSARLLFMTFHGKPRADKHTMDHVHESPAIMLTPLVVLATGALFAGFVFYEPFVGGAHHNVHATTEHEEVIVEHTVEAPILDEEEHGKEITREQFWGKSLFILPENDTVAAAHGVPEWVKMLPVYMGVIGLFLGWVFYLQFTALPGVFTKIFKPVHALLFNKWYFDELYDAVFVKPAIKLGKLFWASDKNVVDGIGPDGVANRSVGFGALLSRFQSGYVFQYAFVMMIGLIAMISWFYVKMNLGLEHVNLDVVSGLHPKGGE